ncbi:hypothetical protein [Pedobacter namyangjuensis]|uniref:hypothetical protein n=1 Tax=Pedobacter namyangjuensis TaxID=600626 RepID=UPI000DE4917B|nr:hypothetical protein [Pedobacter namyangjuensis]
MLPNNESNKVIQTFIDFDKDKWPDQILFPLIIKAQSTTLQSIVDPVIEESTEYMIITRFTSLSNLIDLFGSRDFSSNRIVKILIGFEPNIKGR